MKQMKLVVGANYGDEGKGLVTAYFGEYALSQDPAYENSIINVLSNGGAQRGHTVETSFGNQEYRHVFHHFGSATFSYPNPVYRRIPTYFSKAFMINPIIYNEEREKLLQFPFITTDNWKVYSSPDCRITTIYDMILNRMVEEQREKDKHGSCGLGIYETFNRNKTCAAFTLKDIYCNFNNISLAIKLAKEYFFERAKELKLPFKECQDVLTNLNYENHYANDLYKMFFTLELKDADELSNYDTIIVENAQGLLLDMDMPTDNKTPSHTGRNILPEIFSEQFLRLYDIEECLVTRPYYTRHGAGLLENECSPFEIKPEGLIEKTNITNPYQGTFRYAKIDKVSFGHRLLEEAHKDIGVTVKTSIAFTHLDEVPVFQFTGCGDGSFEKFTQERLRGYHFYGKEPSSMGIRI